MFHIDSNFSGGVIQSHYSDIGDVLSYVPRYYVGGARLGNRFPSRRKDWVQGFFLICSVFSNRC